MVFLIRSAISLPTLAPGSSGGILSRQHTLAAVETLVSVMEDLKAPHSARVAAANGLLDRGHGKAPQHIEANVNVLDSLSFAEMEALLAALDALDAADEPESALGEHKLIGNGTAKDGETDK